MSEEIPEARPRFYRQWLGDMLPAPSEIDPVDCLNCYMVKPKGFTRDLGPFKASLKCCTFQPFLPSFTIGALLEKTHGHELEDGVASLRRSLDTFLANSRLTRIGAIPRTGATSVCETGKHDSDGCPFLSKTENAVCTIRDFRPSTCAGYVCRSSQGAQGFQAWSDWENELSRFESTLSHLSAFDLGFTLKEMDVEFPSVQQATDYYRAAFDRSLKMEAVELL